MAERTQSSATSEAIAIEQAVHEEKQQSTALTAEEVINHPAYASTEWDLKPTKSGKCQVADSRTGGPFNIAWEIHGTGKTKIVWVMGLGAMRTAWKRQTKYFGHEHGSTYSCLIYDNRGIGLSDKPSSRYSTSEMAQDVIEVLTSLGWYNSDTPNRDLNIIGISMGGMIVQEIGLLIPDHIQSLQLISTAPRIVRTVPFIANIRQRINMFIPRPIDVQLEEIAHRLFTSEFLSGPDIDNPNPKLNYPTIRDRFAAGELQKRADKEGFPRVGFILQAIAAGWHHKSAEQLQAMRDAIGANRILVMHGEQDRMITFPHFEIMRSELGEDGITYVTWDDCGHVPVWEKEHEFNSIVESMIQKTGKLDSAK